MDQHAQMMEDRAYVELFWNDVELHSGPHALWVTFGNHTTGNDASTVADAWARARKLTEEVLREANYLWSNLSVLQFAKNEEQWSYAIKLVENRRNSLLEGIKPGLALGPIAKE